MRLIRARGKPIGPQGDVVDDPFELGPQRKVEADAGRADHEIKDELVVSSRNRDRIACPTDLLPDAVGVNLEPRLPACAIEGVGWGRLVVHIEMPGNIPADAVVELRVMRENG